MLLLKLNPATNNQFWKLVSFIKLTGYWGDLFLVLESILYILISSVDGTCNLFLVIAFWSPEGVERQKPLFIKRIVMTQSEKFSAHSTHQQPKYPLSDAFFAAPPTVLTHVHLECTVTQLCLTAWHFAGQNWFKRRNSSLDTRIARSSAFEWKNHERIWNFRCILEFWQMDHCVF